MSFEEMVAFLARVSYKPGWALGMEKTPEGPMLRIVAEVENSYKPGELVEIGINSYPAPWDLENEERFMRWLQWRLSRIELHEMDEWLKVDGQVYLDPHSAR